MRANAIYRSKRWKLTRRKVMERDGYRCQNCGRAGRLECDHKVPLFKGGAPYDMDNLQMLCRKCHFNKTYQEVNEKDYTGSGEQRRAMKDLVRNSYGL